MGYNHLFLNSTDSVADVIINQCRIKEEILLQEWGTHLTCCQECECILLPSPGMGIVQDPRSLLTQSHTSLLGGSAHKMTGQLISRGKFCRAIPTPELLVVSIKASVPPAQCCCPQHSVYSAHKSQRFRDHLPGNQNCSENSLCLPHLCLPLAFPLF